MAKAKGGKTKEKKGKKPHKNKKTGEKYKHYSVEGGKVTRKKKSCIKCGPGVFLATHKDRSYCGKCGYTEFEREKEEKKEGSEKKEGK